MNEEKKGIRMMIVCACLWSTGGVLLKYVPWNAFITAGARALIAGTVVLVYIKLKHIPILLNRHTITTGTAMGLTCTLFVLANKYTTAANAIALQFTAPAFLMVFSVLLHGRRFCRRDVTAVLLTMGGIALFFLDQLTPGRLLGNVLGVCSGCAMGLMYLFMGEVNQQERLSSVVVSDALSVALALPFLPFQPLELEAVPVVCILLLGVFQIGIPYVLYALAAGSCPALGCCLLSALEPLLNPVWVLLFYGERPGPFAVAGSLVVIVTVTVWSLGGRGKKSHMRTA